MFHRAVTNWGSGEAPVDMARGRASPLYTVCAALISATARAICWRRALPFPLSRTPADAATWPSDKAATRIHNAGEIMREIAA